MEQTNYMALVQGLKLYIDAMRRFVRERLTARYAARWWEDGVLTHLYDPQRSNLERDVRSNANREKQDFIDPGHLVHIIAEESRGAFAGYFDDTRRSKPLLQLVLDARNTHAHPPSGDLSRDDVDYALATIEQLLTGARQPEAATVHQLRMGLHDASRPSNTTMPTTRLKASQELDGAIVNARDLKASDVAGKRVLCPACEEFTFQMWPGGWDGHSGWKCTGIAGSDPEERKSEFRERFGYLFRRR